MIQIFLMPTSDFNKLKRPNVIKECVILEAGGKDYNVLFFFL